MKSKIIQEVKSAFRENKFAVYSSVLILFLSLLLGYFLQPYLYDYLNPAVEDFNYQIQNGIIQLTFEDIFGNNIRIVFQMFISGIFFCFSALMLAYNGFFVGYYVACRKNLFEVLLLIIPHGVFEFSSCIIACASGFVLFNGIFKFFKTLFAKNDYNFSDKLKCSFKICFHKFKQSVILLIVASLLMAIAGFVESYLTIPIAQMITFLLNFI